MLGNRAADAPDSHGEEQLGEEESPEILAEAISESKREVYTLDRRRGRQIAIGLKGHVLNPAFPEDYSNWQKTNPRDLIDAPLIKEPTEQERSSGRDEEGGQGRRRRS